MMSDRERFLRCAVIGLSLMWTGSALGLTQVFFVDHEATGANNGGTWENAYTNLQDALTKAGSSPYKCQIWVASGSYKPDTGPDREKSFVLQNDVEVYGGFTGDEDPAFDDNDDPTFDFASRHLVLNETTLSGDLATVLGQLRGTSVVWTVK